MQYYKDLKGKTVIITGGSKGIGKGCAKVFCEAKANVVICARGEKEGESTAREINKMYEGKCLFHQCDMSKEEDIKKLINFTVGKFGRIDCLINNCGYLPSRRPLDEIEEEDYIHVLKTNLISVFIASKYALPYIRKVKGSIINMSSIIGITGQEGSVMYTSIKAAITTLGKSLAIDEAKNGVRVNTVAPGHIVTELYEKEKGKAKDPEAFEVLCNQGQWMGRGGTPEEVAYACLFLASEMAAFITGTQIIVSGGFELGNGLKMPLNEMIEK